MGEGLLFFFIPFNKYFKSWSCSNLNKYKRKKGKENLRELLYHFRSSFLHRLQKWENISINLSKLLHANLSLHACIIYWIGKLFTTEIASYYIPAGTGSFPGLHQICYKPILLPVAIPECRSQSAAHLGYFHSNHVLVHLWLTTVAFTSHSGKMNILFQLSLMPLLPLRTGSSCIPVLCFSAEENRGL